VGHVPSRTFRVVGNSKIEKKYPPLQTPPVEDKKKLEEDPVKDPPKKEKEEVLNETPRKNYSTMVNMDIPKDSLDQSTDWWKIKFGDVVLGDKIGEGGFGVVYRGEYGGQKVAVKMLHREQVDEKMFQEFQREAALMVNMNPHENVVATYGVCIDSDNKPIAIVAEYLEKGSLRNLLEDTSTHISFLQAIGIGRDIAKGMEHIHSQQIFHRDLSARNILVKEKDGGWICKVADFSLSRFAKGDEGVTRSNTGPLKWMAPESLSEKKYGIKSDVWSFGVTLCEVLTRQEPYPELDNVQAASHVMHKGLKPRPPDNTPLKLTKLIEQCFQTDPKKRPTFSEIIQVFDEVEEDIRSNPFYSED